MALPQATPPGPSLHELAISEIVGRKVRLAWDPAADGARVWVDDVSIGVIPAIQVAQRETAKRMASAVRALLEFYHGKP
jgi:hypothetical protein